MTKPKIVVLDDDPTGTQSVHNTTVLLQWDADSIARELEGPDRVFYLLTNSRALIESESVDLARRVGLEIRQAAAWVGVPVLVVSRSDSTLRGHYPAEVTAIAESLGNARMPQLLVPAFLDGGRVTIDGEHCIRGAMGELTKVSETEFARDATFGFSTSFLPAYVEEKTSGDIRREDVIAIRAGVTGLPALPDGSVSYADASEPEHLTQLADAVLSAVAVGQELLVRSAASLVPSLAGLESGPRWAPDGVSSAVGGLVVVGSYVRKSTEQLEHLQAGLPNATFVQLDVPQVLDGDPETAIATATATLASAIRAQRLGVLATTRELVSDTDPVRARSIGQQVATALNETVRRVVADATPAFVVGKGGITSSDLATVSLGARRARVLGQIVAGVSVWDLDLFPGLPYVVFPGNVGGPDELLNVVQRLTTA